MDRPDIRALFGKGGCGKSTLAREWSADAPRVLIHDVNGEAGNALGAHVTSDPRQLRELLLLPRPVRVCWRYEKAFGPDAVKMTGELFEWANECAWVARNLLIVWDEADRLMRAGFDGWGYAIVNQGRHRDLSVFAASRRPAFVPRTLTASATRIAAFRTTEPRDIDYLRAVMGEAARQLPALGEHDFLDWSEAGTSEIVKR